jgi:hypothetical protein
LTASRAARGEEIFADLAAEIEAIRSLPEKSRARIRQEAKLVALFERARAEHLRTTVDAGPTAADRRQRRQCQRVPAVISRTRGRYCRAGDG